MRIRVAEERDTDALVSLVSELYDYPPYDYVDENGWLRFIKNNYSLVCEDNGKIIGHGGLEMFHLGFGVMARSFVHPDFRRKGVYSGLVEKRLDEAEEIGFNYVDANVVTYDVGVQRVLIEKFGFIPVGLKLLELPPIFEGKPMESLVVLRKAIVDEGSIPYEPAEKRKGCVPYLYDVEFYSGEWCYSYIEKFDFSSLKLHEKVKYFLNL